MFQLKTSSEEQEDAGLTVRAICSVGEETLSVDQKMAMFETLSMAEQTKVVRTVLCCFNKISDTVQELGEVNEKLHDLVTQLSTHPWHVAIFRDWVELADRRLARVFCAGEDRLVAPAADLDESKLGAGETVYLSAERNVLMAPGTNRRISGGQLGEVSEVLDNGELIVHEHDLDVTLERAHWLGDVEVREGDQVTWCPRTHLVFEVTRSRQVPGVRQLSRELSDPPPVFAGYEDIRDDTIEGFLCGIKYPEDAARYGLSPGQGAMLLYGPPGCGKTLLARNLAHELGVRFFVIDASSIFSPWVGESEKHLLDAFRRARESGPSLLFIDEIDAIGRARGSHTQQHADRVVSVLLTQLEGATGMSGIAVIGACNRVDLLDPALRSRFGRQFMIPRPGREALRAIAGEHLACELPFAKPQNRERCIDILVHGMTSPNADTGIATLRFRDGRTRAVSARDLISGRSVRQMVAAASECAFRREMEVGEGVPHGIEARDIQIAVEDQINDWRGMLCVANVRGHLTGLPEDVDVVAVEAVRTKSRPARYLLDSSEGGY